MADFAKNLGSDYWWLSVVVVSVVLNMLSTFLYKRMDTTIGKASTWWRSRSELRARKFRDAVEFLRDNTHLLPLYLHAESRDRIRHVALLVLSILFFVIALSMRLPPPSGSLASNPELFYLVKKGVHAFGMLTLLFAMNALTTAARTGQIISQATGVPRSKFG